MTKLEAPICTLGGLDEVASDWREAKLLTSLPASLEVEQDSQEDSFSPGIIDMVTARVENPKFFIQKRVFVEDFQVTKRPSYLDVTAPNEGLPKEADAGQQFFLRSLFQLEFLV